jgi:subtilisin
MADPIYRLPPYRLDALVAPSDLGQVQDWGIGAGKIPEAWLLTKGEGVKVAVLDTGVEASHPDLVGQFAIPPADGTGSPIGANDKQGHGTHCAGIVAGSDNSEGIVGVSPKCKLIVGKVLGDDGSGRSSWIAAGIRWAVSKGAHVISMSLGSPFDDATMAAAIAEAASQGVFIVCAAGNSGQGAEAEYPGADRNAVAIASINESGKVSDYSSRGRHVMFAAPGEKILSTFPVARYAKLSGTSMACPFIAGLVALLVSRHLGTSPVAKTPLRTRDELIEHLRRATVDIGAPGHDTSAGWGVVDGSKLFSGEPSPPVPDPLPVPPPAVSGVTIFIPGGKVVKGA